VPRVIAVDWSGNARAARKTIWLAEVGGADVVRLEAGRNRAEVTAFLLAEAERDPDLVVGLDFAFSLPAWFLAERGIERVTDAWQVVEREGATWLSNPTPPFGHRVDPALNEHARDALVSAHAMVTWQGDWTRLPRDSRYELEGRIWHPGIVQPSG
jgi:hypothetical protein